MPADLRRAFPFAAERAGFEPAVRFDPHTAFPVPHLRPLGHLSEKEKPRRDLLARLNSQPILPAPSAVGHPRNAARPGARPRPRPGSLTNRSAPRSGGRGG